MGAKPRHFGVLGSLGSIYEQCGGAEPRHRVVQQQPPDAQRGVVDDGQHVVQALGDSHDLVPGGGRGGLIGRAALRRLSLSMASL